MSRYFFVYAPTGYSWPVDDPVAWLLDHADNPFLERARERLVTLAREDADRILRLVTRRCRLVLIDLASPVAAVVHYWGKPAPDIRGFLKRHRLARPQVQVALANRKIESIVLQPGSDFRYGEPVKEPFPWEPYRTKYERRRVEEADDDATAPGSFTNFGWPGVEEDKLPWRVLKALWRTEQVACPDCDGTMFMVWFSWHRGFLSFNSGKIGWSCFRCRTRTTSHEDEPLIWLAKVLEPALRPTHLQWHRPVRITWEGPKPRVGGVCRPPM